MYFTKLISRSLLIVCAIKYATSADILEDEDDTIYDRNNHDSQKTFHNQFAVLVPRGRDARDPVRALLGVQALDIMGSRTPRGGVSIAGFRPEGGFRLQGFRIFGREAPETAPKAPF